MIGKFGSSIGKIQYENGRGLSEGDMTKSVYDKNSNNIVDNSEALDNQSSAVIKNRVRIGQNEYYWDLGNNNAPILKLL